MKTKIKGLINNPLVFGTAVMFVGSNLANAIGFLYHFLLGRMLGKETYGELAAFLSIVSLCSSVYAFVGIYMTREIASTDKPRDRFTKVASFFLPIFLTTLTLISFLVVLFRADLKIGLTTALMIFFANCFALINFFIKAYYQGMSDFIKVSVLSNVEMIFRLILAVILVYMGAAIYGVTIAYVLGASISLFVGFRFLKPKMAEFTKRSKIKTSEVFKSSFIPIAVSLGTTVLMSVDIIVVRYLLSEVDSGTYSASLTIGRMVMYATTPIAAVLLPILAKKGLNNPVFTGVLGIASSVFVSLAFLIIFYYFSPLVVSVLYGNGFPQVSDYVLHSGLNMSLLSLVMASANIGYAKNRSLPPMVLFFTAIFYPVMLLVFASSIETALLVGSFIFSLSFVVQLLYFAGEAIKRRRINSSPSL